MADIRTGAPLAATDERELLTGFLEFQRGTLEWKCRGLTDEQLRTKSVAPADVTLLGLLRHMAVVERHWLRTVWAGEAFESGFYGLGDRDPVLAWQMLEEDTGEDALARWKAEIEQARKNVAAGDLDAVTVRSDTGEDVSARWILIHMVEEYARHNGHADLLRQAVDGQVGE